MANSGKVDSGKVDSGKVDSGKVDSGKVDSGKVDSGKVDSGKVDSGKVDSGKVNSGKVNPTFVMQQAHWWVAPSCGKYFDSRQHASLTTEFDVIDSEHSIITRTDRSHCRFLYVLFLI